MKKISLVINSALVSVLAVVGIAQAQIVSNPAVGTTGNSITSIFNVVETLANRSIGLLVTIALAVFFWGLVKYLFKLGNDEGKGGKSLMIYGLVALFVMVSVWGLIYFIANFFGVGPQNAVNTQGLVPTRTF
jgi:hypothetical protein